MSISQALVADFEAENQITRRVLEAVPEDRLEWKPHEKSMSLAELVGHLAEAPGWTRGMLQDELDFADIAADYRPFVPASRSEALAALEKNAAGFREALGGRDDAFLQATWTMKQHGKVLMSAPRVDAVRSTILHHCAHHRGQLTVYLRLLDVPVPNSYGPTADYPTF